MNLHEIHLYRIAAERYDSIEPLTVEYITSTFNSYLFFSPDAKIVIRIPTILIYEY